MSQKSPGPCPIRPVVIVISGFRRVNDQERGLTAGFFWALRDEVGIAWKSRTQRFFAAVGSSFFLSELLRLKKIFYRAGHRKSALHNFFHSKTESDVDEISI